MLFFQKSYFLWLRSEILNKQKLTFEGLFASKTSGFAGYDDHLRKAEYNNANAQCSYPSNFSTFWNIYIVVNIFHIEFIPVGSQKNKKSLSVKRDLQKTLIKLYNIIQNGYEIYRKLFHLRQFHTFFILLKKKC